MGPNHHHRPRRRLVGATAALLTASGLVVTASATPATATPCPIAALCFFGPDATTTVAITGSATVGSTLTLNPPTWDQSGVTTTYQWWRDSTVIGGATGTTYTTVTADIGHAVTVVATGTNARSRTGVSTSNAITVSAPPTPPDALITSPAITGRAAVGELLTTTLGVWRAPQPTLTVQWYRRPAAKGATGFVPIKGATETTYEVRSADAGATLAAVVDASNEGSVARQAPSNLVKVDRLATTISVRPVLRSIKRTQRATVVITLTSTAFSAPTGTVVILADGKKVAKVVPQRGTARVRLRKLPKGKHVLQARYQGSPAYAPSISRRAKLKVT